MDKSLPSWETRGLTQEAFDLLLSRLHPDRERAGEEYLLLWQKLILYFQSRACQLAEELADETLNRVANKIAQGEELRNTPAYCYGVARLVWLEYLKKPGTNIVPFDELPLIPFIEVDEVDRKELQDCFDKCLRELPTEEARLLVEYWYHEGISNRDARREITQRLGISPTALRIRIYRIKGKFEECFKKCRGDDPKVQNTK